MDTGDLQQLLISLQQGELSVADAMERLRQVDTLVVDKTGTLTEGKPRLVSVVAAAGATEAEVVALAAGLERGSEHPLAAGILAGAVERNVALAELSEFRSLTGRGVTGVAGGRRVALGNARLMQELDVDPGPLTGRAEALRAAGQTVMFLVEGDAVAGILGVADPIKPSTPEAIRRLQGEGLRVIMLTGDSRVTAQSVAHVLHLDDVIAEVLPEQKVEAVRRLHAEGRVVAMAGDGVNDAPALAAATVGIAVAGGAEAALTAADVFVVRPGVGRIAELLEGARRTMRVVRRNLIFSLGYNVVGVTLAMTGVLNPLMAAILMPLSSLTVILSSYRARTFARPDAEEARR